MASICVLKLVSVSACRNDSDLFAAVCFMSLACTAVSILSIRVCTSSPKASNALPTASFLYFFVAGVSKIVCPSGPLAADLAGDGVYVSVFNAVSHVSFHIWSVRIASILFVCFLEIGRVKSTTLVLLPAMLCSTLYLLWRGLPHLRYPTTLLMD